MDDRTFSSQVTVTPTPLSAAQAVRAELSPLDSLVFRREHPDVVAAFEAEVMREQLQQSLFGPPGARHRIERCTPGKATFLPGEGCSLRYELEVRDAATGRTLAPVVNARLFQHRAAAEDYLDTRLAPLAAAMRGREEVAPFVRPVALLETLDMCVSLVPIDGDLPALVGATDRLRMMAALREILAGSVTVEECRVELGRYQRRHRCVLRYRLEGTLPGTTTPVRRLVYGKVAADHRGAFARSVLTALRERLHQSNRPCEFAVPRCLGYLPDLRLVLLEALPGVPYIAETLEAQTGGHSAPASAMPALAEAIDTCAGIASTLHSSGLGLGPRRTLDTDLIPLCEGIGHVQQISPGLGAQFSDWLERVRARAAESEPQGLRFSHGDFTNSQVLFGGAAAGLLDFDNVCQAEPALDLGQFLAYFRYEAAKAETPAPSTLVESLCARFLDTYVARSAVTLEDEARLRRRVSVYEAVSLLRMALHSWQQFKDARLGNVLSILEERMRCLR